MWAAIEQWIVLWLILAALFSPLIGKAIQQADQRSGLGPDYGYRPDVALALSREVPVLLAAELLADEEPEWGAA